MNEIIAPEIDSVTLYKDIISRINKRKKKAQAIIDAKEEPIKKESYIFDRYKEYERVAPDFNRISDSIGITNVFKSMLKYVFDKDSLFKNAKVDIYSLYGKDHDKCPYCMFSEPNTLDHYLCKSKYPEFTLYPLNLVPCCSTCNRKKGDLFLDEYGNRQFLHYYYDKIPAKPVLRFEYSFTDQMTWINFYIDDSIKGNEYDIFRRQFEKLYLRERMRHHLNSDISITFKRLYLTYEKMESTAFFRLLEDILKTTESSLGANHYEAAIYRSILEDKHKFESSKCYVMY